MPLSFRDLLCLLSKSIISANDRERIGAALVERPEYALRTLEKSFCTECICYTYQQDARKCPDCGGSCIPKDNDLGFVSLVWNFKWKIRKVEGWIETIKLLKSHGVRFDRPVNPYDFGIKMKTYYTPTAYTTFFEKQRYGQIGSHQLSPTDQNICDQLLTLANKFGCRHQNGRVQRDIRSPSPKRQRLHDQMTTPQRYGSLYNRGLPKQGVIDLVKTQAKPQIHEATHCTARFMLNAPSDQYIDAEEAFAIQTRQDFPTSTLNDDDLRSFWVKEKKDPNKKKTWMMTGHMHNLAVDEAKKKKTTNI